MIRLLNLRKRLRDRLRRFSASQDILDLIAEIEKITDDLLAGRGSEK